MKRREFITLLGGAAVAWPLVALAQQPKRMRRVGALMPQAANDPQVQERNAAFLQGLQQLGWTVGQNLQIEYRWAGGNEDDTRKYAAELVTLAPEVIFTAGSAGAGPLRLVYCARRAKMRRGFLPDNFHARPFGVGQERGLREQLTTKTGEFVLLVASYAAMKPRRRGQQT
jgi:hypothetical protein